MWILFVILLANGQINADFAPVPFKTQAECETAKAKLSQAVIAKYPTAETSFTCFKANDLGKNA